MAATYRARGSIGWIVPPRCNETIIEEAFRIRPRGVSWAFASLGMEEFGKAHFDEALAVVEAAARDLVARQVGVIIYSGMPLTASRGGDYHQLVTQRIRESTGTEVPITTDTALVCAGLRTLGASRISLVTPYQETTVRNVADVFRSEGFEVVDARGLGFTLAQLITEPTDDTSYDLAMESFGALPDTDAFYLGCPQWPVVGNIGRLEEATGRPVVTQVQAAMWWAAAHLGVDDLPAGYGRLLEEVPPL